MNLWDALTVKRGPERQARLHCWSGDSYDDVSWQDVVADAERMGVGLRRAGVRPGVRVATVLTNHPSVVRGVMGAWLAGGVIASLPVPARGMAGEDYVRQLTAICEQLRPGLFVVDQSLADMFGEEFVGRFAVHPWQAFTDTGRTEAAPVDEDDIAFIQYSSGSTTEPKGCALTPRAIAAQLDLICEMLDARAGVDVACSWLPLSHDMGMFGCLLAPWARGFHLYLSSPERFMWSPKTWVTDLSEFGGNLTAGPNAGLQLALRACKSVRLSSPLAIKAWILGAERVEWETLRLAVDTLGPFGLTEAGLMPAYGLAEATLAVTSTPVAEVPRHVTVDAIALADGELHEVEPSDPSATRIVSAGVPCKGVELPGVLDDRVGDITVRSASLATGYFEDETRTKECFRDGAVATGDLGFVRDGYLYPVGRVDDVISISGRKVYAREIESAVDGLRDVRRGCSTLIKITDGGTSRVSLVVELRQKRENYHGLAGVAREAAAVAMAKGAIALDECVFLEKGSLPKTPSGKIQRYRCEQMVQTGQLRPLATVALTGRA
jgi:fatty-acyl-CoA synthase